jgi:putative nucleotidyltransferase with HDIG domain
LIVALGSVLFQGVDTYTDMTARMLAAISNGMLAAFLAAGLGPVLENLGGHVSDMRLLEIATFDHPLLRQLSVHAPGTWNHSMVVGMMVEAGADAIGANPVLARVGAYFHDIGKVRKPLYFAENQGGAENRHERLSPSMSALIIRAHVRDGIEMAQKHGLPEALIDMIPQHHGTALIEYFYEKARLEAEEKDLDPDSVDEEHYRYHGPKPQTKEAGILMLADGTEAAARTISEPSHDRIQGLVQKCINKVFASRELEECDLTLKDLHLIAKAFTRVLCAIHHQRVTYHEPAEKVNADLPEDEEPAEEPQERAKAAPSKQNREELKRLGI